MSTELSAVREAFASPGNEHRGKPFWSWNGALDEAELIRQIHAFKEMGFGGFFMHSRTGLQTEYLGERWFALINRCADEAERLGLEPWLYDEDRWPSGTASGMVTANPEYRMRFLTLRVEDSPPDPDQESIYAVYAGNVEGLTLHRYRPLEASRALEAGERYLVFRIIEMPHSDFYNGYTYVDTMNPAATAAFLSITHERYAAACGPRLGRLIPGIFTDEPHRGQLMSTFGEAPERAEWAVPWSDGIPERFLRVAGYSLEARLPELFLWLHGEAVSPVKWCFVEVLQQLFLEGFAQPVEQWCAEHRMRLTGHVLHEDSLTAQTAMSGSVMRFYEHMSDPGIDLLTSGNRSYWVATQAASVARQTGRTTVLSELYGCTGWGLDFAGHKMVGNWQTALGVTLRCHHLSWYTMRGEAKRDYPASINVQSAWWPEYRHVEDYFARLTAVLTAGTRWCPTLVITPVESGWCQVAPGWCDGLDAAAPEIRVLEETYRQVFTWLTGAQLAFDYGDEEMLGRLGGVDAGGGDAGPLLRVGQATYSQVVVAGLTTIRSTSVELLERFIEAGGRVIAAGPPPQYADAVRSDAPDRVSRHAVRVPLSPEALCRACAEGASPPFVLEGAGASQVIAQTREIGEALVFYLVNTNREEAVECALVLRQPGALSVWDAASGEISRLSREPDERLPVYLYPGGDLLLVAGDEGVAASAGSAGTARVSVATGAELGVRSQIGASIELPQPVSYELSEPNVLVLDVATGVLEGPESADIGPTDVLWLDRHLRSRLGFPWRGGDMLQPWFAKTQESEGVSLRLRFRFQMEARPSGPVWLVGEEAAQTELRLNGHPLRAVEQGHWVDACFTLRPVPAEAIRIGENLLELWMSYGPGSGLEAVYLLGDFGVRLPATDDPEPVGTITALPETLRWGDICSQGLPHYSGRVRYRVDAGSAARAAGAAPGRAGVLGVRRVGAALVVAEHRPDAHGETMRAALAWPPYQTPFAVPADGQLVLEAVLTRRNTFGPLHQLPAQASAYGPSSFVTSGARYSATPIVVPAGILTPPTLSFPR